MLGEVLDDEIIESLLMKKTIYLIYLLQGNTLKH